MCTSDISKVSAFSNSLIKLIYINELHIELNIKHNNLPFGNFNCAASSS
jgi:hypothetical protein